MGLVTTKLQLSNPREPSLSPIEVAALADTGSVFLCIPEHVRLQLKLDVLEHREVKLADGSRATYPYVGPIVLRLKNRIATGICEPLERVLRRRRASVHAPSR